MVDPDLGDVARVVADGDALAHEGGERGIEIAQAAEADAVAPDHARTGLRTFLFYWAAVILPRKGGGFE